MGNDALSSRMNPAGLPSDVKLLPTELKVMKAMKPEELKFIEKRVQKVGYTSHLVGKWHLGTSSVDHHNWL